MRKLMHAPAQMKKTKRYIEKKQRNGKWKNVCLNTQKTKNKPFGCNKELTQGIYQCVRLIIQQYLS